MDKFIIQGGNRLTGSLEVSGAKNASLPLMAAAILAPGIHRLRNVPQLRDVRTMAHLLRVIGARVDFGDDDAADRVLNIDTTNCSFCEAPYELVKTMRASIYVLGPLLARFGEARVSMPGGCAWGPRPVDLHIAGFEKLGASISLDGGYIEARASELRGTEIDFPISSVGATGNVMMAAVLARGTTTIRNAAREPEIVALAEFLNAMGAEVQGAGSEQLVIEGVKTLHPVEFENIPDRIEAGTLLCAAAIAGGDVTLNRLRPDHLTAILSGLKIAGFTIDVGDNSVRITAGGRARPVEIRTEPYPGFPTDMQAQWIALMSVAEGNSSITDTIYPDRFTHVAELRRLGARIEMNRNTAHIEGVDRLIGAPVMSTDLRASASLILAGLAAHGSTDLSRIYHIDRGYERIEEKLRSLGADIQRVDEPM